LRWVLVLEGFDDVPGEVGSLEGVWVRLDAQRAEFFQLLPPTAH